MLHMCEFVAQDVLAIRRLQCGSVASEEDIAAEGEGHRAQALAELRSSSVIVQPDGTSAKQTTAVAIGARVSAATHRKVGFDGTVTYVPSDVTASSGATGGSSSLVLIDARAVMSFGQAGSKTRFYVAGGPAIIIRNGEFYQDFEGTTDIGGNVAAGLRIALGKVNGRVEVEGYLYSVSLTGAGNLTTGSEFQTDLIISASVAIPLGSSETPSP